MLSHTRSLVLLLLPLWIAAPVRGASFQGLDDLAGGAFFSFGYGVSADGSVAVGVSDSGADEAFRWNGAIDGIGDLPAGFFGSQARAASGDGSIVAGTGEGANGSEAFRFDANTDQMTGLGSLLVGGTSAGLGISSDGLTLVGRSDSASGTQAFRWQGAMVGIGDLGGGSFFSQAFAVSGDGNSVVGDSSSGNGIEAFVWTLSAGVPQGLGDLDGGVFDSHAYGISGNGSFIVGQGSSDDGDEAFLWNGSAMVGLGDLDGGTFESVAYDVSNDGVAVGQGHDAGGLQAVIWDGSPQAVIDLLVAKGLASEVAGWTLTEARAISDDGLTIVGVGTNPLGQTEAWIATIPEPGSGALLAMGLAGIAGRRAARRARSLSTPLGCASLRARLRRA